MMNRGKDYGAAANAASGHASSASFSYHSRPYNPNLTVQTGSGEIDKRRQRVGEPKSAGNETLSSFGAPGGQIGAGSGLGDIKNTKSWDSAGPRTTEKMGASLLESSIDRISQAAEKKKMSAYGDKKTHLLDQIGEIRKRQIDIFRRQMNLELTDLSMDDAEEDDEDGNDEQFFSSEGFSEKFQQKFKNKEKSLDVIRNLLERLNTQLKDVNDASTESKMPPNPGHNEPETSSFDAA